MEMHPGMAMAAMAQVRLHVLQRLARASMARMLLLTLLRSASLLQFVRGENPHDGLIVRTGVCLATTARLATFLNSFGSECLDWMAVVTSSLPVW